MKINPDLHIPGLNGVKGNSEGKKSPATDSFSELLGQLSASGAAKGKREIEHAFAPSASALTDTHVHTPAQTDAIAASSQALDLLEHLGSMLLHLDSSNSSIASVAAALEEKVGLLAEVKDTLEANDPLRGAIDEIGVTAIVASMKIERGDFSQ